VSLKNLAQVLLGKVLLIGVIGQKVWNGHFGAIN
jgi:hypothetical protein